MRLEQRYFNFFDGEMDDAIAFMRQLDDSGVVYTTINDTDDDGVYVVYLVVEDE